MSERGNVVEEKWQDTLQNVLDYNMLINTVERMAAFASGVALVIESLEENWSRAEVARIRRDLEEFIERHRLQAPRDAAG